MPSLSDICRLTTSQQVVGYLLEHELIENIQGQLCGKVHKYEGSGKSKQPCTGIFNIEGPHLNNMYWRCNKAGCRRRKAMFENTLLDQLKIPLPDILQIIYLSLLQIPVRIMMFWYAIIVSFSLLLILFFHSKNTLQLWYVMTIKQWRKCRRSC